MKNRSYRKAKSTFGSWSSVPFSFISPSCARNNDTYTSTAFTNGRIVTLFLLKFARNRLPARLELNGNVFKQVFDTVLLSIFVDAVPHKRFLENSYTNLEYYKCPVVARWIRNKILEKVTLLRFKSEQNLSTVESVKLWLWCTYMFPGVDSPFFQEQESENAVSKMMMYKVLLPSGRCSSRVYAKSLESWQLTLRKNSEIKTCVNLPRVQTLSGLIRLFFDRIGFIWNNSAATFPSRSSMDPHTTFLFPALLTFTHCTTTGFSKTALQPSKQD